MNQQIFLLLISITLVGVLIVSDRRERLAPWDVEDCRLKCYKQGEQIPWFGGPGTSPRKDPASGPSSNFDVAGCMARCNKRARYYY